MKKSNIFILTLSLLLVVFLSTFVGLTIGKEYAENHYQTNTATDEVSSTLWFIDFGCGENDCKYCNGKVVHGGHTYKHEYAEEFVYYRTLDAFWIVSLVGMCVSAFGLGTTLIIKYKEPIKKVFKKANKG